MRACERNGIVLCFTAGKRTNTPGAKQTAKPGRLDRRRFATAPPTYKLGAEEYAAALQWPKFRQWATDSRGFRIS